jgi:hypothetical protein
LPRTEDQLQTAPVLAAVSGSAGVSKTALAVHWAHQVRQHFPDGQLYLDLRGHHADDPVSPGDALARLLGALDVAGEQIPLDLDDRAARYRTELAGRRLLVLLDNAGSAEQVRPLLPGTRSCLVLVTSRDRLPALVALYGAPPRRRPATGPGGGVTAAHPDRLASGHGAAGRRRSG